MADWFICIDEKISGPCTLDETVEGIRSGRIPHNAQIWGRAHNDWLLACHWIENLPEIQKNVEALEDVKKRKVWHFAIGRNKYGPFSRSELAKQIKDNVEIDQVKIWTKGMKAWASIYDFHDLLDELGIEKRSSPRAPLIGSITIRTDTGQTLIGQMRSISTGGFGAIQLGENLSPGQTLNFEIRSKFLAEMLTGKATVQYISEGDFVGFKFQSLSAEGQSRIIQYVKSSKKSNSPIAA